MALVHIDWNPRPRVLRQFGVWVLPLVCAAAAASAHWKSHNRAGAAALLAAAAIAWMVGLARPSLLRPVFVGATLVTFPVAWVASYVVLALLFFGVFFPAAAIMKWLGRDPMTRTWDRSASTYWTTRHRKFDLRRYFRQF